MEEYERQKMSSSQRALQDLLENIIHDRKMNPRDKKKRLKQVNGYSIHDHTGEICKNRFGVIVTMIAPQRKSIRNHFLTQHECLVEILGYQ